MSLSCSEDSNTIIAPEDTTPPSLIDDLIVSNRSATTVTLTWTAPGDDDIIGKAREYDLRYSEDIITEFNWDSTTQFTNISAPQVVGYTETMTVTGLSSNTKYYFAVKTADEVPNWSGMSNIDSATTMISGNWILYNYLNTNGGLISDTVVDIAFQGGIRYFATNMGLAWYENASWDYIDTANSDLLGNEINNLTVDLVGRKWIGTNSSGISVFDGISIVNYTTDSSGLSSNSIEAIVTREPNDMWIATAGGGLAHFKDSVWSMYITQNSEIENNILSALEFDINGTLWIGYNFVGVGRIENDSSFTHFTTSDGLASNSVSAIASDSDGKVWVGTGFGLSVYNGTTWTTYRTSNSGLVHDVITSLAVDQDGDVWIGTIEGLSRFDGINWTTYTIEDSFLPDNFIWSVKVDQVSTVWIGTNHGVAQFYN